MSENYKINNLVMPNIKLSQKETDMFVNLLKKLKNQNVTFKKGSILWTCEDECSLVKTGIYTLIYNFNETKIIFNIEYEDEPESDKMLINASVKIDDWLEYIYVSSETLGHYEKTICKKLVKLNVVKSDNFYNEHCINEISKPNFYNTFFKILFSIIFNALDIELDNCGKYNDIDEDDMNELDYNNDKFKNETDNDNYESDDNNE